MSLSYVLTNESINLVWEGKNLSIPRSAPNYQGLKKALVEERWSDVPKHLTVEETVKGWSKGKFKMEGSRVLCDGVELPAKLGRRISEMAGKGESVQSLLNFWERLQKNPSYRSLNFLWDFLETKDIPLTPDGCFLAYKSVTYDYLDHYSRRFTNRPGTTNKMIRNQISDDENVECAPGFHVGSLNYAQTVMGAGHIVICKVAPENVVSVPRDYSGQKMRVCEYTVVGNHGGPLSSTVMEEETPHDIPEKKADSEPVVKEKKPLRPKHAKKAEKLKKNEKKAAKNPKDGVKKEEPKKPAEGGRDWSSFKKMNLAELMNQSLQDLRDYAFRGCAIVGASKIPGGKTALVTKITQVRGS